ncbi:MAG: V-type ATPase subunit, partial [Clostridiales bacterium]|nr:V-type ATPase subunit [Clostridiales bacterium]
MGSNNDGYVEISAYLRVLEKRLLSTASLGRIMDAPNVSEVLRQITQNSSYDFSALQNPDEYEAVLKDGLLAVYTEMRKLLPGSLVIEIPAAQYAFHNVKVALKAKHTGKNADNLFSPIPLEDMADPPDYIREAIDAAEEAFKESGDPQDIDVVLDKLMFKRMFDLCAKIDNAFITDYVRESADFYNI